MKPERKPVDKTLRALSWLVEKSPTDVGVRQLAAGMKIAPSSAHRILLALAEAGFVRQVTATQRYTLGNEFLRVSQLAVAKAPIRQAGLPAMQRLVDAFKESALLCVFDECRQEVVYSAAIDGPHSGCNPITLNKWMPVRTGASGLAILAFLREDEFQSVVRHSSYLQRAQENADECGQLRSELATVRGRGYSLTHCQWVTGAVGLAAPIFGHSGRIMGDICVTIPRERAGNGNMERLIDATLCCARDVSRMIENGASLAPSLAQ